MRYRADITAGALKLPESRVVADLLIRGVDGQADIAELIDLFQHGKTFGSLIRVPEKLRRTIPIVAAAADLLEVHQRETGCLRVPGVPAPL